MRTAWLSLGVGVALVAACWLGWHFLRVPDKKTVKQPPAKPVAEVPERKVVPSKSPPPTEVEVLKAPSTNAITNTISVKVEPPPPPVPAPATNETPPVPEPDPNIFPRPVRDILEAQIALARHAVSPGSIDGVKGGQTRAALLAFQRSSGLRETGVLDSETKYALSLSTPPLRTRTLRPEDFARLQPLSRTWLGKSQQSKLDYETISELLGEESQSHPNLLRRLNPSIAWDRLVPGTEILVPVIDPPEFDSKAAYVLIRLAARALWVLDSQDRLLAHFPCSIASRVDKRPVGQLHVEVMIPNPNYTFDPEIFSESEEARRIGRKIVIPPGPNNPVGVAWIGLDRPGYGIHGTPIPEQVGRTESHGCFRLANWNAAILLKLAWVGMPIVIE